MPFEIVKTGTPLDMRIMFGIMGRADFHLVELSQFLVVLSVRCLVYVSRIKGNDISEP